MDIICDIYNRTNVSKYNVGHIRPCGNCDYECLKPRMLCPNRTSDYLELMDTVCKSDLIYFVVPKFCGYPNAAYFAFNEKLTGYFNLDKDKRNRYLSIRKRFIVISNTEIDQFRNAVQQQTKDDPEILYLHTRKYHCNSINGDMMNSPDARVDLLNFIASDLS